MGTLHVTAAAVYCGLTPVHQIKHCIGTASSLQAYFSCSTFALRVVHQQLGHSTSTLHASRQAELSGLNERELRAPEEAVLNVLCGRDTAAQTALKEDSQLINWSRKTSPGSLGVSDSCGKGN